jgi:hypothetical protein
LIETRSFACITLAVVIGQLLNAMMYGPQAALFAELFTTRVRYSGASLGYQLGSVFGGALAPIIATTLRGVARSACYAAAGFTRGPIEVHTMICRICHPEARRVQLCTEVSVIPV